MSDNPATSPDDLLRSLLASFGKEAPRPKKAPAAKATRPAPAPLPLPQAFAQKRTGYRVWKAVSRVIQLQRQICTCCGEEITAVKGEFFALENGLAHSVWLRHEGYGIEEPAFLPLVYVDLDDLYVPGCASCRSTPYDDLFSLFHPRQMELPL